MQFGCAPILVLRRFYDVAPPIPHPISSQMKTTTIIGISDSRKQWFSPEVTDIIAMGKVFSGGKRHHEIMASWLPADATWIDITVPLSNVFEQYKQYDDIVIFASGDPLFYGFANTVKRECPDVVMKVYPSFNSLQMLAHRLCLPYHDMHVVSLTGRPWLKFDEALINDEVLIGCLTDKVKTPHAIFNRMKEYGYDNYIMYVGENLGNEETERISQYDATATYAQPNCIILRQTHSIRRTMGIADTEFMLLDERSKMITKMPIRLCTLSALDLAKKRSLWDVGFCTGSISIEAKLRYPHLTINAFEIREEGRELMAVNSRKFHAPGINAIIGDFCQQDITSLEAPDAVFIGGYGGKMDNMLRKIHSVLKPDGCIVFNSVSDASRESFLRITHDLGMTTTELYTIKVDDNNPITILKAVATVTQ